MKDFNRFDQRLRQALYSNLEPSIELNEKILNQLKENEKMKSVHKKRLSIPLIAATVALTMSVTAFAAWQLLSPVEVAEQLENVTLAQAFQEEGAIKVNQSATSGEYIFTLMGIVSGEGLSDFPMTSEGINPERTYAVVSIAREDGSQMPGSQDEAYGEVPFFVSPLIKGQKPWQVNIASMNGGYSEFVADGIMYRLIECDDIEMFADRGLYLAISTSSFYDINAFDYNEATGEITPKADYEGANVIFDLPLDPKKADHEKAEAYLKNLLKEPEERSSREEELIDWEGEAASGKVIPESIKEVTYDNSGRAIYEYEGARIAINIDTLFEDGKTSKIVAVEENDNKRKAIQLSIDANGIVTGMMIELD